MGEKRRKKTLDVLVFKKSLLSVKVEEKGVLWHECQPWMINWETQGLAWGEGAVLRSVLNILRWDWT